MAAETGSLELDRNQVKKAAQCLLAYLKTTSSKETLLLNEGEKISLLFTFWTIPKQRQTIRIPLPHGIRTDTGEVCLFTRNEPNMTGEQMQRFYKKLLKEKGITGVTEVIPLKVLRTEYKSYESKQKLLGNFDLFLTDNRIRQLLPPLIGKHFYNRKKVPLQVNLMSKQVARSIEQLIKGSVFTVTKKGSCCMAHVARVEMTADEIVENIVAAVKTISLSLPLKGLGIKIIHLKSQSSAALPIYTSDLSHLSLLKEAERSLSSEKRASKRKQGSKSEKVDRRKPEVVEQELVEEEEQEEEEEIPQLVPIKSQTKKAKLEVLPETKIEKATKLTPKRSKETIRPRTQATEQEEGAKVPDKTVRVKTPLKGKASPQGRKLVKSARKGLKTPEQKLRRKVPQSC